MSKREKAPRQFNSSLPQRTTRLTTSKPMRKRKPRTADEKAAKFAREYGGPERHAFVESLPCLVPGCPNPSRNAHVVKDGEKGMSRKAGYTAIAPCCDFHHTDPEHGLHKLGPRTFERLHRVDLAALAAHTERQWQRHQSDLTPLSRIVPGVVRAIVEGQ